MEFNKTKWNASEWTRKQKIKFQEKAFELGFTWCGSERVDYLEVPYYFLEGKYLNYACNRSKGLFADQPYTPKTYEDMFPEDTLKIKSPKWVTANTSKDFTGIISDKLTHNKDYKVLEVYDTNGEGLLKYRILSDRGVEEVFHKSWFYPEPSLKDILPDVRSDLEEDPFGGLIYKDPSEGRYWGLYFVLLRSNCSPDQWRYAVDNLPSDYGIEGEEGLLQICNDGKGWFEESTISTGDIIVSFNDIFIEQEGE